MGRKKISLRDKMKVKKRLAEGKSYSEAIKGTAIQSARTVGNIKKRELQDITQLRKEYLTLIEGFDAGDINRAQLWAEMTRATKIYGTRDDFIEIPDWTNRERALRYIDELKGIYQGKEPAGALALVQIQNIIGQFKKEVEK